MPEPDLLECWNIIPCDLCGGRRVQDKLSHRAIDNLLERVIILCPKCKGRGTFGILEKWNLIASGWTKP